MVTLLRPTGRSCNTTDQLIGTVKLHWPGADTPRTPGVRPLGPTDQAIPARYLEMSAEELDQRIARARADARRRRRRARPPLPARRDHQVRRLPRRLVQALPAGRRPPGGRVHRLLRRPLHGRERRHPLRRPTSRSSCRTSRPAARWPTWPSPTTSSMLGRADRPDRRDDRAGHLHELGGRAQGVLRPQRRHRLHLVERRAGRPVGLRARRRRSSSSPTSTSAATPALKLGYSQDDMVDLVAAQAARRPHRRRDPRRQDDPLARPVLGPRALLGRPDPLGAREPPGRARDRPPRVQARGRRGGRRGRLDRVDHQAGRGGAGRHDLGGRHRDQPRRRAWPRRTRTRRSSASTRSSAPARRCTASTRPTSPG